MSKVFFKSSLILFCATIIMSSCKKDNVLKQSSSKSLSELKLKSMGLNNLVTYNSTHDVLMFNSFEDISRLEEALNNLNETYPYDQGNLDLIFVTLSNIRQFGFTNGNGNVGNKVNLNDFRTLLEESYPLSDSVLKEILLTYESVNPSFAAQLVRPVFEGNVPFSYSVREQLINSSVPNGIKNQILNKEDEQTIVPNLAFNDFLNAFPGYNSLFKKLEDLESQQLQNGMDPINPLFDNDIVGFSFDRLMLNERREVYIKGYLFKLYSDCKLAIFQGSIESVYAQLANVNEGGTLNVPNISESIGGLPLAEISQYFPVNFGITTPQVLPFELKPGRDGLNINLDYISSDLKPECPSSLFTSSVDLNNQTLVQFNRAVALDYNGDPIHVYWNFGDGTGSFQNNPTHQYAQPGSYVVKLTTFNDECGCWDVYTENIGVGLINKSCEAEMDISTVNSQGQVTVTFSNVSNTNPNAVFVNYIVNFGDGSGDFFSPASVPSITHQYTSTGVYNVTATAAWDPACYSEYTFSALGVPSVACCDRYERFEKDGGNAYDIFLDGSARLSVDDVANGGSGFLGFGARELKGEQKFFRKKNNGSFTGAKADHIIKFSGTLKRIDGNNNCSTSESIPYNDSGLSGFNKKSVTFRFPNANAWDRQEFGMGNGAVSVSHWVSYGGKSRSISVNLGNCP